MNSNPNMSNTTTTKLFVRQVPELGFWNKLQLEFVPNWKDATRYTEEQTLTASILFPNERWMQVSE